ncbi:hypothetical protein D3C86_1253730 [compost metagenome]
MADKVFNESLVPVEFKTEPISRFSIILDGCFDKGNPGFILDRRNCLRVFTLIQQAMIAFDIRHRDLVLSGILVLVLELHLCLIVIQLFNLSVIETDFQQRLLIFGRLFVRMLDSCDCFVVINLRDLTPFAIEHQLL